MSNSTPQPDNSQGQPNYSQGQPNYSQAGGQQPYPYQGYQQPVGYPQPPPYPPEVRRPWNITLVAIIALLVGLLDVVGGVWLLIFRNETRYQEYIGLNASNMAVYGAFILIVGAIVLLVAFGLFGGSRLARGVIAFLSVLRIAISVVGILLTDNTTIWGGYFGEIIIAVIVLCLLYAGERTRLFFRQ